jgi:hypothetical protein
LPRTLALPLPAGFVDVMCRGHVRTRGLVETRRVSLARGRTCRSSGRNGRSHPGRARRSRHIARLARGANTLADLPLVTVHLRSVDVPVAYLDCLSNRLCGLVRLDLEDSETELRDDVAIVEGNVWYHAQSRTTPLCLVTYLPDLGVIRRYPDPPFAKP